MRLSFQIVLMSTAALLLPRFARAFGVRTTPTTRRSFSSLHASISDENIDSSKGKILVLGGTGFLGQNVCRLAALEGYSVVSLSRRGVPPEEMDTTTTTTTMGGKIDYRQGDARQKDSIANILQEDGKFVGVIHCIGLLFDDASGLGSYNKFVSGSGSLPDSDSTYETITRQTAFNAIDASIEYAKNNTGRGVVVEPFPFCFTSAAEAGWPDMAGGSFVEGLAPDFLKRYLAAKRAVESKLLDSETHLRPIIVRPSLIYSMDRPASYIPVGAFFVGNKIGLPFVDQPVTVQALSRAMVRALAKPDTKGILRYPQINELAGS